MFAGVEEELVVISVPSGNVKRGSCPRHCGGGVRVQSGQTRQAPTGRNMPRRNAGTRHLVAAAGASHGLFPISYDAARIFCSQPFPPPRSPDTLLSPWPTLCADPPTRSRTSRNTRRLIGLYSRTDWFRANRRSRYERSCHPTLRNRHPNLILGV